MLRVRLDILRCLSAVLWARLLRRLFRAPASQLFGRFGRLQGLLRILIGGLLLFGGHLIGGIAYLGDSARRSLSLFDRLGRSRCTRRHRRRRFRGRREQQAVKRLCPGIDPLTDLVTVSPPRNGGSSAYQSGNAKTRDIARHFPARRRPLMRDLIVARNMD
jgi:hypothetical protein